MRRTLIVARHELLTNLMRRSFLLATIGVPLLTIDSVGAGVGERVLIVVEGRAAGEALRRKAAPVDAAIIGIIDAVTMAEAAGASPGPEGPGLRFAEGSPGASAPGTASEAAGAPVAARGTHTR